MNTDVEKFWNETDNPGEPEHWSKGRLRSWLLKHCQQLPNDLEQLSRTALLQRVTDKLEQLYSSYKPKFDYTYKQLDPAWLLPWTPRPAGSHPGIPQLLEVREAGRLEREFNSMWNFHETMAHLKNTLPMGESPATDLRQDLLLAAQTFDRGTSSLLYQTHQQHDALSVSIRRAVALLPQHKFKPGEWVIILRGPGAAAVPATNTTTTTSSSSSSTQTWSPGAMGTVAQPSEPAHKAGSAALVDVVLDGQGGQVQVPGSHLLLVEAASSLREGSWVVLHGLQKQPDLCGQLGRLLGLPPAGAGGVRDPDARCQLELVPWLSAARGAGTPQDPGGSSSSGFTCVAPRLSCVAAVQQPQPALLVAWAHHHNRTPEANAAAIEFMSSQVKHLLPVNNVRTNMREQQMLVQYMKTGAGMLGPLNRTLAKDLLGSLNPKLWRVGLMVPIKAPTSDAKQHKQAAMKQLACRCCDKTATPEQPLQCCQRCHGAWYCSKECQRADWKARHKVECKSPGATDGGADGDEASSSGTGSGGPTDSVLVPMKQQDLGCLSINGDVLKGPKGGVPRNIHGDKEFLVKLQYAPGVNLATLVGANSSSSGARPQGRQPEEVSLYDRPKSFFIQVPSTEPGFKPMVALLMRRGRPGRMNPMSRVVYARARREGPKLRVYLDQLPLQQQPW